MLASVIFNSFLAGKGRGLVAGCQLRPGDLVMLARPLSVLHGQQVGHGAQAGGSGGPEGSG